MRCVIAQHSQRLLSIPEADQRDNRIDRSFRFGAQRRVGTSRVTYGPHFAVWTEDAAIRGHLFDLGLAQTEMSDWPRVAQRGPNGGFKFAQRLTLETAFVLSRSQSGFLQNLFGGKV